MRFYIINGAVPFLATTRGVLAIASSIDDHGDSNNNVVVIPDADIPSEDAVDAGILSGDNIGVVDDIDQYEHHREAVELRSKGSFYPTSSSAGSIDTRIPSSRPISSSSGLTPTSSGLCPTNDYIICVNGNTNGITCASACNGQCCTGSEA